MKFPISNFKFSILNSQFSTKRGFTLIELVVYFGIFSLLLIMLTNIFGASIATQLESESLSSVEQDSRYLLLKFSKDISEASSIVIPASPGNSASTLRIVVNGTNYDYALTNGNLILTNNSGANNLNNFNTTISNFSAARYGNINGKNTVTISFAITSKIRQSSGSETKTFTATFGTR